MADSTKTKGYATTVHLPRTDFAMRANLPEREPRRLALWKATDAYGKLRALKAGRPKFILHDGPPYSNEHIHLGTAVNKIVKDFIVRSRSMLGYDAPYVPGWDNHGMPIEIYVTKEFRAQKREPALPAIRTRAREYAAHYVGVQSEEFQRLGGWGDWERPYLTMSNDYEAAILELFADLVESGYVYRGLRPIHWCIVCRTALAEAELEYHARTSPSITVRFPLREDPRGVFGSPRGYVLIWTTTPWTLPANQAVVVHRDLDYAVYEDAEGDRYLFAAETAERVLPLLPGGEARLVRRLPGRDLAGLVFSHPLGARNPAYDRPAPLFFADHVSVAEGTGVVHTAPGHGAEDFEVGRREGLEILNPVDEDGRFNERAPGYEGKTVWEANPLIMDDLDAAGHLLERGEIQHSYPHDWRCKSPVIFRATVQWFLALEHEGLRARALREIARTRWLPPSGEGRITGMVAGRPDWCLSRQRVWGVGIPAFFCFACKELLLEPALVRRVAAAVREHGSDVWYERPAAAFLPDGTACAACGGTDFYKEVDILDVWFDSGASHRAVLETRPDLGFPADVYFEGLDQHRGWFNSSLLLAVATRDRAPYRAVLTHGWMLDAEGRAMHKSQGNVISPMEVVEKLGADVLRLWTASTDYAGDRRFSWDALEQTADAYRRIRNTCRFLLGNLHGFDPARDVLPESRLEPFDGYALARLEDVKREARAALEGYEFHQFTHLLVNYCAVELSGFYLDALKTRLYTRGRERRRSAQTVLHAIADTLARLLAPILPFTAEEVWEHLPKTDKEESVHFCDMAPEIASRGYPGGRETWERLLALRPPVQRLLERMRAAGEIGAAADAELTVWAQDASEQALLESARETLRELLQVSNVRLKGGDPGPGEGREALPERGLVLAVGRAAGQKCERCWQYRESVGRNEIHPTLCDECIAVLEGDGGG
ncbi:MAG TPA: isoleucine--tRNA ligase [Gemmatimonadota bacterium]|jgi:isoleucyl-tRNA synthetase